MPRRIQYSCMPTASRSPALAALVGRAAPRVRRQADSRARYPARASHAPCSGPCSCRSAWSRKREIELAGGACASRRPRPMRPGARTHTGARSPGAGSAGPRRRARPATCPRAGTAGPARRLRRSRRPRRRPRPLPATKPPANTASRRKQRALVRRRAGCSSSRCTRAASAGAAAPCGFLPVSTRKRSLRALGDRLDRKAAHARSRKLERQRDAIEALADRGDRRRVLLRELQTRAAGRPHARRTAGPNRIASTRASGGGAVGVGNRKRRNLVASLRRPRAAARGWSPGSSRRGPHCSSDVDQRGARMAADARSCRG